MIADLTGVLAISHPNLSSDCEVNLVEGRLAGELTFHYFSFESSLPYDLKEG